MVAWLVRDWELTLYSFTDEAKGLETLAAQEIRDPGAVTNTCSRKTEKNLGQDK